MSATLALNGESVFQAISDPTRREILALLRSSHRTVGDIAKNFSTSRPAISKHLKVLKSAGLVTMRPVGASNVCELNAKPLQVVDQWLSDYQALRTDSLSNLKSYIEENP